MEFPIFQMGFLGNGMYIGIDAILHVFLSHGVAIGTVAMIALAEYVAVKRNLEEFDTFAEYLLKPAVIVITGIGAVTGVGIWFTTSALAPAGIGSMLRIFLWSWFTEWIVFTLEVVAILIFFFVWDKWKGEKRKYRYNYGFAYVFLATWSNILISGNISFMLTSDGWPWDKNFWYAFLNPTFVPMLILRESAAFVLGATIALAFALFLKRSLEFKKEALRLFGKVLGISLVVLVASTWWYFTIVPSSFKTHYIFAILTSHASQQEWIFWVANGVGAGIIFLFTLFALTRSVKLSKTFVIITLVYMIAFVAEYERIREFIRGPYLMPGYMYANQILLKESNYLKENGMLNNSYWFNAMMPDANDMEKGGFLFGQNCSMCHTFYGINPIYDRVYGRTEDGIAVILNHTNEMVPFMPPFSGTEEERRILAEFLYHLYKGDIVMTDYYRYLPLAGYKKK